MAEGGIVLPVNYLFSIIYHQCCSALSSVSHKGCHLPGSPGRLSHHIVPSTTLEFRADGVGYFGVPMRIYSLWRHPLRLIGEGLTTSLKFLAMGMLAQYFIYTNPQQSVNKYNNHFYKVFERGCGGCLLAKGIPHISILIQNIPFQTRPTGC